MKKKWFAAIAAVTVAAATLFMLAGCDNTSDSESGGKNSDGNTSNGNQNTEKERQDGYLIIKGSTVIKCDTAAEGLITVPQGVTAIGDDAFNGCSKINIVYFNDGVKKIGARAFRACSSLTSIELPESLTSIGSNAFEYCTIATINFRGTLLQVAALDFESKGVNMAYVSVTCNYGKSNAGKCYFKVSDALILATGEKGYVIIPDGVTSIVKKDFYQCTGLLGLVVPTSVTYIESGAFNNATNLTEVDYAGTIADWVERGFTEFSTFYERGLLIIDGKRANEITAITKNDLSGVSSIINLKYWSNLKSVSIPNSVTSIDSSAFEGCTNLTSIELPNSVTSIGSYAFSGCSGLTSIDIPNSVTSIGSSAFAGCTGLTSIDIPNSVTEIGSNVFSGCTNLSVIEIGESISQDKDQWSSIFSYSCTSLSVVKIKDGTTSIGKYAFYNCPVTSIEIPSSVTSIGSCAFSYSNVTSITMCSATPPTFQVYNNYDSSYKSYYDMGPFYRVTATIYVPSGSKDAYVAELEQGDIWNYYDITVEEY